MTRFYPNEQWKEIQLADQLKLRYAISNFGRAMSFTDNLENGRILKLQSADGYSVFRYKIFLGGGKILNKTLFVRKLVAEYFLPKTSPDQTFVLLLDRNRTNNRLDNLKWATKTEMIQHSKTSPAVIHAKQKLVQLSRQRKGHKLTATKVQYLKMKLLDPNHKTRLKILAKQFGISEMQLHRIKTGENWGHIKINGHDSEKNLI